MEKLYILLEPLFRYLNKDSLVDALDSQNDLNTNTPSTQFQPNQILNPIQQNIAIQQPIQQNSPIQQNHLNADYEQQLYNLLYDIATEVMEMDDTKQNLTPEMETTFLDAEEKMGNLFDSLVGGTKLELLPLIFKKKQ